MNARGVPVLGACLCWFLSAGPFVLDAGAFAGASRAALAALPWVAWAGLPRRDAAGGWRGVACELALFAPPLVLGAALDVQGGVAPELVWRVACGSALCATTLAGAARAASAARRTRLGYAVAWLVLVAATPLAAGALTWFGSSGFGAPPGWLAALVAASPIAWLVERLPAAAPASGAGWAVLVTLLVCVATAWIGRAAPRGTAA